MVQSPPAVLVVGASREADMLRGMLDDLGRPFVGLNDCATAGPAILAAHPFDRDLLDHALEYVRNRGLPFVVLLRPGWQEGEQDDWRRARNAAAAARIVEREGWRHVLLAVGQTRQPAFENLACVLHIRRQGAPSGPEGRHEILGATGPFTVAGERRLLRERRIEAIVAHDAGGPGGWPKIEAARLEGLPVVLIDRPAPPDAPVVTTPEAALNWLANL